VHVRRVSLAEIHSADQFVVCGVAVRSGPGASGVDDQQATARRFLSTALQHRRRVQSVLAVSRRRTDRDRFAVVNAGRRRRLKDAAERRYLAHEDAPELLADEAVDGEIDGRVEGEQSVAGDVSVAQGRDVQLNDPEMSSWMIPGCPAPGCPAG